MKGAWRPATNRIHGATEQNGNMASNVLIPAQPEIRFPTNL